MKDVRDRYFCRDLFTEDFAVLSKANKEQLEAVVIENGDEERFEFIGLTNAEYLVLVKVGLGEKTED